MSRANPIALRITSKTQSCMYIGVSQYYFYDHVKQNINICKLTELLSKQIVLPTNKLVKHNAVNSDNFIVLTPHLLPINTACGAKQLFSTKYALNKRRFCSVVLHYVRWLQDNFNKQYKRFNSGNAAFKYEKPYKLPNLAVTAININGQYAFKKNHTDFCHITKANQIGHIHNYFLLNRFKHNICNAQSSATVVNSLIHASDSPLERATGPKKVTKKGKIKHSKLLSIQNFKKTHSLVKPNRFSLPANSAAAKANGLQTVELLCRRPSYEHMTYSMFLLACLSLLYWQNKHVNQASTLTCISLSNRRSIGLQKTLLSTDKAFLKPNDPASERLLTKHCYAISPYSGLKKSKDSNFSKVQKHINSFRNTVKPVTPLELVIYRGFCEPAGLNYISALENRLSKSNLNISFSNALFRRASKNGFIANHTNTQTGLIRLKAEIIFEFLYTVNNHGELGVQQNNHSNQYTINIRNQRTWLRKGSSIRL
uniref:Uncharacterized protein n=1 Tax=Ulva intestinalis TaxID=3116 RepID=A0A8K1HUY2_ULVIN|nr:hypothetical protein LK039_mgp47 [Ulva intestinalis]UBR43414.1 hypothetical protein [Ulva intestinalis]